MRTAKFILGLTLILASTGLVARDVSYSPNGVGTTPRAILESALTPGLELFGYARSGDTVRMN